MFKVIPGCARKQAPSLQVNWIAAFYLALYFLHSLSLKYGRFFVCNSNDVKPSSDRCTPDSKCLYCTPKASNEPLAFWFSLCFIPLGDKGFEFSGQWVFNCLVSTFSLYPRHLTFQGQASLFECLSSAPVQWLSGCLRRSFHSLQLIYRYTFLCVHVLGMAVIAENGTSWRAILACQFISVDPWNIVNFWYSKLSWEYIKLILNLPT